MKQLGVNLVQARDITPTLPTSELMDELNAQRINELTKHPILRLVISPAQVIMIYRRTMKGNKLDAD